MAGGFLIALEGIDGAGKTTQARLLAEGLQARGYEVVLTREPSDGPAGRKLRGYLQGAGPRLSPLEELNLFMADRREHVAEVIRPALARGAIVVTDRYYYSSMAYQGARGLDSAWILAENEAFAPAPDLVFILVLVPALGLGRLKDRGASRQMTEARDYLQGVADIYQSLSGEHLYRLDAGLPVAELQALILQATLEALGRRDQ